MKYRDFPAIIYAQLPIQQNQQLSNEIQNNLNLIWKCSAIVVWYCVSSSWIKYENLWDFLECLLSVEIWIQWILISHEFHTIAIDEMISLEYLFFMLWNIESFFNFFFRNSPRMRRFLTCHLSDSNTLAFTVIASNPEFH